MRRTLPIALVAQPRALRDAEPMLLVDHDEPERGEADAVGEQRVRADHDIDLAGASSASSDCAHRPCGVDAVSSSMRSPAISAHALPGLEVLLGEQLGRRHHRGLAPCPRDLQRRGERDRGLARADVALK